jgi:hypothetical protein
MRSTIVSGFQRHRQAGLAVSREVGGVAAFFQSLGQELCGFAIIFDQ